MRFARVTTPHDRHNPTLDRLVATGDLDVVQLDYEWPHGFPSEGTCAAGFLRQLKTLHKAMYLDPKLHVITNAGADDLRGCVEAVADFLCDHGSAALPLSLIRGHNVLPCLDRMLATGVELTDIVTGKPVQEFPGPVRSAHVELGAGPLATALNEDSRMVITGCYDVTAPAIATAVSALGWSWDSTDVLAQLAAAAQLPETIIDVDAENDVTIQSAMAKSPGEILDLGQLHSRLLECADGAAALHLADVTCKVHDFVLQQQQHGKFRIAGVTGTPNSGQWRLHLDFGGNAQRIYEIPRDAVAVSVDTRPAAEWK